jgi:VanZ family protein
VSRFLRYALPPLLYAGLIFYLSSQPGLVSPPVAGFDKMEHLAAYAVLGALVARALMGYGISRRKAMVLAVLIGGLYGVSDELHQSFVPTRSPDWRDVVADLLGSSFGAGVFSIFALGRQQPPRPSDTEATAKDPL